MRQLVAWFAAKIPLGATKILLGAMKRRMVHDVRRKMPPLQNKGGRLETVVNKQVTKEGCHPAPISQTPYTRMSLQK
jgi:hypothetical protein